jgi:hypothetical protein
MKCCKKFAGICTIAVLIATPCGVVSASSAVQINNNLNALFKPIVFGKKPGASDNILLRRLDEEAVKKFKTFLASSFVRAVEGDKQCAEYARQINEIFVYLLRGITSVSGKFAIYAQRKNFGTASQELSGAGSQEALTTRKYTKLEARKSVENVNPTEIPWGDSGQGGALVVSVDQAMDASLRDLPERKDEIRNLKKRVVSGKQKCFLKTCKTRYEILAHALELAEALARKIANGEAALRKIEGQALARG